jgi:hypothetical protein
MDLKAGAFGEVLKLISWLAEGHPPAHRTLSPQLMPSPEATA